MFVMENPSVTSTSLLLPIHHKNLWQIDKNRDNLWKIDQKSKQMICFICRRQQKFCRFWRQIVVKFKSSKKIQKKNFLVASDMS